MSTSSACLGMHRGFIDFDCSLCVHGGRKHARVHKKSRASCVHINIECSMA